MKLKRSSSDTLSKVGSYENSMAAWTDARLPDLKRSPGRHHHWMRCTTQAFSQGDGSPRPLGPDLAEDSFAGRTMAATASAAVFQDTRKAHGYFEPGILRRSKVTAPCGWAGTNVDRMPRGDRFLTVSQPHEIEVGRSTVRETRFLPAEVGHTVDVR